MSYSEIRTGSNAPLVDISLRDLTATEVTTGTLNATNFSTTNLTVTGTSTEHLVNAVNLNVAGLTTSNSLFVTATANCDTLAAGTEVDTPLVHNGGDLNVTAGSNSYSYSSTNSQPKFIVNSNKWLGGVSGPSGTATTPFFTNNINFSLASSVTAFSWIRVANRVFCNFTINLKPIITGVSHAEFGFVEMTAMRTVNFSSATDALGSGMFFSDSVSKWEQYVIEAQPGTKNIIFTSKTIALDATTVDEILCGSFSFITSD